MNVYLRSRYIEQEKFNVTGRCGEKLICLILDMMYVNYSLFVVKLYSIQVKVIVYICHTYFVIQGVVLLNFVWKFVR